jgi:hypothetical protein
LVELPNHEDNPIVKSEKAQRLQAILCKSWNQKSEAPTSLHMISKCFGRQQ